MVLLLLLSATAAATLSTVQPLGTGKAAAQAGQGEHTSTSCVAPLPTHGTCEKVPQMPTRIANWVGPAARGATRGRGRGRGRGRS